MYVHGSRGRQLAAALAFPLAFAVTACMGLGPLVGKATDEWTRTYSLSPGGIVRIVNTNGKVEIEGVDGSSIEVRAVRIARAATDEGARQLLPRISIREDVTPDRVSIETERMGGIMIGAGVEVQYHVKAPRSAIVNAATTNGSMTLSGMTGKVTAGSTNGGVTARDLGGAVDVRTTNGNVNVELTTVSADRIRLSTTNGSLTLTVPETTRADLSATCTNGGISVTGLRLETSQETRRHLEGKINGGGTPIELRTTNGGIRVRTRTVT